MSLYFGSLLIISIILIHHQGVCSNGVRSVIGNIGQSVTLETMFSTSMKLSSVRWSIYENLTIIATFHGNNQNVKRWPHFTGRLKLNITSGDLTINYLTVEDSMKYRVELEDQNENVKISYIQLHVQKQLKPQISVMKTFLHSENSCFISLLCSSSSSNTVSWKVKPDFNESYYIDNSTNPGESVLWTSFTPNRNVTFSCSSTDGDRTESSLKTVYCPESPPSKHKSSTSSYYRVIAYVVGGIVIVILFVILLRRKSADQK